MVPINPPCNLESRLFEVMGQSGVSLDEMIDGATNVLNSLVDARRRKNEILGVRKPEAPAAPYADGNES